MKKWMCGKLRFAGSSAWTTSGVKEGFAVLEKLAMSINQLLLLKAAKSESFQD
jgi:hypothetical protein